MQRMWARLLAPPLANNILYPYYAYCMFMSARMYLCVCVWAVCVVYCFARQTSDHTFHLWLHVLMISFIYSADARILTWYPWAWQTTKDIHHTNGYCVLFFCSATTTYICIAETLKLGVVVLYCACMRKTRIWCVFDGLLPVTVCDVVNAF